MRQREGGRSATKSTNRPIVEAVRVEVLVRSALPLRERGARCRTRRRISTTVASGACCARPVRGSLDVSRLAGYFMSSTGANGDAPLFAAWGPAGRAAGCGMVPRCAGNDAALTKAGSGATPAGSNASERQASHASGVRLPERSPPKASRASDPPSSASRTSAGKACEGGKAPRSNASERPRTSHASGARLAGAQSTEGESRERECWESGGKAPRPINGAEGQN